MGSDSVSGEDTFLALDIGGTNVKCGLVTRSGAILGTHSFPTQEASGPEPLIRLIAGRLKGLAGRHAAGRRPKAIAMAAPGWLKAREGIVVVAPNIPGWKDVHISKLMGEALGIPAHLENDANLYALGEWLGGAGKGHDNMVGVTLGTGVGGGLILEGRLWAGPSYSAAEIGHIPLGGNDRLCGCGRRGCLETIASATGVAQVARERLLAGEKTIYEGAPDRLTSELMVGLAGKGDPLSLAAFREAGEAIGLVLASIFNILGIDTAVIGGGGAGAFEFLKPPIMGVLGRQVVASDLGDLKVLKGTLGGDAPFVGAAALLTELGH
ncbi:MAG: ROK family protein [Deltaproteobacteria bacterium]|jgi:glucokinase|nr:ROK family protein [Deltaproteobacteria bacterium]